MVDMSLRCHTERTGTPPVEWQTGVVVLFLNRETRECIPTITLFLHPWHSLLQGFRREAPADCLILDSWGAVWLPSWSLNNGLDLHHCRVANGLIGV